MSAIGYYRATLAVREAELASLEAELMPWGGARAAGRAAGSVSCPRPRCGQDLGSSLVGSTYSIAQGAAGVL